MPEELQGQVSSGLGDQVLQMGTFKIQAASQCALVQCDSSGDLLATRLSFEQQGVEHSPDLLRGRQAGGGSCYGSFKQLVQSWCGRGLSAAQLLIIDYQPRDRRIELYRAMERLRVMRSIGWLAIGQLHADGCPVWTKQFSKYLEADHDCGVDDGGRIGKVVLVNHISEQAELARQGKQQGSGPSIMQLGMCDQVM